MVELWLVRYLFWRVDKSFRSVFQYHFFQRGRKTEKSLNEIQHLNMVAVAVGGGWEEAAALLNRKVMDLRFEKMISENLPPW